MTAEVDRLGVEADEAVLAYRKNPTEENRAKLLAANKAQVDAFYRAQAAEFIQRTRVHPTHEGSVMTRNEIAGLLREFIMDYRIDPHDAGLIYGEIGPDGLDAETLGDQLEMHGYPELALVAYEKEAA